MTINLTREDFEQAIKSGASVFEGNTIPDTGKPSGRYYRFIRVPLANGEHKVDALYGQRFYGTLEKKPVTFNQEIRFLCLVEMYRSCEMCNSHFGGLVPKTRLLMQVSSVYQTL